MNLSELLQKPGGEDNIWLLLTICGFGAVILTVIANSKGYFAIIVNFSGLFVSGLISNRILGRFNYSLDEELAEPFMLYIVGMTVAALVLMRIASKSEVKR